jgi:hypothetical protein
LGKNIKKRVSIPFFPAPFIFVRTKVNGQKGDMGSKSELLGEFVVLFTMHKRRRGFCNRRKYS